MRRKRKRLRLLIIPIVLVLILTNIRDSKNSDKTFQASASLDEEKSQDIKRRSPNLKDGKYRASGQGFSDDIHVEMIVENGQIESLYVYDHNENSTVSKMALSKIPRDIAENQSVNIDVVSGATYTSKGIIEGAKNCIRQAGGNPNDF